MTKNTAGMARLNARVASQKAARQADNHLDDTGTLDDVKRHARSKWDRDPELRAEFGDVFDRYLAFRRADEAGQVKVLGGTVARGLSYV